MRDSLIKHAIREGGTERQGSNLARLYMMWRGHSSCPKTKSLKLSRVTDLLFYIGAVMVVDNVGDNINQGKSKKCCVHNL